MSDLWKETQFIGFITSLPSMAFQMTEGLCASLRHKYNYIKKTRIKKKKKNLGKIIKEKSAFQSAALSSFIFGLKSVLFGLH